MSPTERFVHLTALADAPRRALAPLRGPILVAACLLFAGGMVWAFRSLGLDPSHIRPGPMAIQLALAPLSLLYGGIGLHLLAKSAGASIPLGRASMISSYATLVEALPVPGGAIVRTGALIKAGARLGSSSLLVILTAILWISLAALGCGLAFLYHATLAAWALIAGGTTGSGLVTFWLIGQAGWLVAVQTLAHRLAGMALIATRLHFAFLALGIAIPLEATLPFALANIAGTAASVAPSGLGISEALAALVAKVVDVAPASAFLAVAIDRLLCLLASGLFSLATAGRRAAS